MHIAKNFLKIALLTIVVFSLVSCSEKESNSKSDQVSNVENFVGNYVSEGYSKRVEGYDWVVVSISKQNDTMVNILVRSRVDKKKATCTFDAKATVENESTLKTVFDGKTILFSFADKQLTINTEKEEDKAILQYFCSGGGSLAGTYIKIDQPLDDSQLSPAFIKTLSLQGITFDIYATNAGSVNTLTIQPRGLEIINDSVVHEIDGSVTNAEIEDLNSDGWPEVLVYINSAGSGSYGSVIGYSVNNGKSMSGIYLPDIMDNPEASKGYMGHDEFAIVETTLVRRFQTYNEGDSNANPTGDMRQIQYKLVDGEASRLFKIDKILEFPTQ